MAKDESFPAAVRPEGRGGSNGNPTDKADGGPEGVMGGDPKGGADAYAPNRKVKDSMFVDLFGKDITARENFISLYNALHGTDLKADGTELVSESLDSVMYMSYVNDVAMRVDGKVVVLVEHQSTINRNMPLRMLGYVARIYERMVPAKKKFYRSRVRVPMPEFYVMYNGTDDFPEMELMRLSDAFIYLGGTMPDGRKPCEVPLELVVKAYNITPGKGDVLLGRCPVLRQYAQFSSLVREAVRERRDELLTWAVKEAMRQGILPEYLNRKAAELSTEFQEGGEYADHGI
ncbi:MAG: Rpn family recombination-promoting nuclease/putative transposase [Treponema sp.]|nr:Rpn family recombination-promoting nuclease/putative transposase [Treponema sp.]